MFSDAGDNNGSAEGSGSGGETAEGAEGAHTFGPLDGSIYATVVRGGGPSSPLSASMDSGISSAGRRAAPSPPDELDALLGDMLRTVSALPDPPAPALAAGSAAVAPRSQSQADRPPDIPYHARADSAPFTYGAAGVRPGMLRAPHRLASPELVRRALGSDRSYRPIEDEDEERATPEPRAHTPRTLRKLTHEDLTTTTKAIPPPASPVTNGRLVLNLLFIKLSFFSYFSVSKIFITKGDWILGGINGLHKYTLYLPIIPHRTSFSPIAYLPY